MAKYTAHELDQAALADLISDVESSERYADEMEAAMASGESVARFGSNTPAGYRAYAKECRVKASKYADGSGLHIAVLKGL